MLLDAAWGVVYDEPMTIPHGGDKQKYRVFCVRCGKRVVVEGATNARIRVRQHNTRCHAGHPVAAYESEK